MKTHNYKVDQWLSMVNGMGVCFRVIKIFWNKIVVMVEQLCEYTKKH